MNCKAFRYKKLSSCLGRWFLLLLCLNPLLLPAQNYPTRHFTMRDGLPSMAIRCIYKDTRGLVWMGTDAGLCSFDGQSFRIYKAAEGMTASQIRALAEDEEGNIWIGSLGEGLYKYDGQHFERFTKKNGMADDRVRVLCYSKNFHCLIAGGYGGITTIRGGEFKSSVGDKALGRIRFNIVTSLMDAGKFIYITTYNHFSPVRYYPDQNKYITLHDSGVYYPSHSFSSYLTEKADTVFSLTNKGLWIYKKNGIIKNDTLGQIFGITEDKRGDLWLAGWSIPGMKFKGGVIRYDGNKFSNYNDSFGITDQEVYSVLNDKDQDILWVGTINEGLFRIPFTSITNYPSTYFSPGQPMINNIYLDSNDNLWISGNKDLVQRTPDGRLSGINKHQIILAFKQFWNDKRQLPFPADCAASVALHKINAKPSSGFEKMADFNFYRVVEDKDHSILFSNEFGVFHYSEKSQRTDYIGPEGSATELAIMADTLIYSGWFSTLMNPRFRQSRLGISHNWDYPRSIFVPFTSSADPSDVTHLVKRGNQLWYTSSETGLWMSEGMRLTSFNKSDTTIIKDLNAICFDEKNHVIFGSNTGEIYIATYKENKLKIDYRINSEKGLQGNSISWLLADQNGKLWAGTNMGLNVIDLNELYRSREYRIRFLDEEGGYSGQSSKSAVMDTSGRLWIGAIDGVIMLNTKEFNSSVAHNGTIILKSLEINNTPAVDILDEELDKWRSVPLGKFSLKYSENDLVLNFDILNYSNPGKERFRYMLTGYDQEWSQWSERRRAVYTNLPPGNYTLRVESNNLQTSSKANPLKVEFTILYPWWGLWYLQLLALLLLTVSIAIIIRNYIAAERKKENQKSEIEKKIVQLEMQALQAQMNPHFIFNCVNGIQYYVLANKMDEVLAYLSDFSKVVRESLENATLRAISLEQEIEFLNSYLRLEKMRFPDRFDYTIHCHGLDNDGLILIPPMVVQPYAENAIRHGFGELNRKGELSIMFEKRGNSILKCTITDNGIGRINSRNRGEISPINDRPHSTRITESRIQLFNSPGSPAEYRIVYTDLSENDNSCGLMVELYLPLEMGKGDLKSTHLS
ncbi:MAG: two-component regulator propeller domain-containing protein [Mariniphaga sp.]